MKSCIIKIYFLLFFLCKAFAISSATFFSKMDVIVTIKSFKKIIKSLIENYNFYR